MSTASISKEELRELYDKDYPLWAEINLELLKDRQYDLVDWDNLLEEIDDMAKSDLRACISYLAVILEHLYKWDNFRDMLSLQNSIEKDKVGHSWITSIENARDDIDVMFNNYPSLETKLPGELQKAWVQAVANLKKWFRNNGFDLSEIKFPKQCPYTYEEAMTRDLKKSTTITSTLPKSHKFK